MGVAIVAPRGADRQLSVTQTAAQPHDGELWMKRGRERDTIRAGRRTGLSTMRFSRRDFLRSAAAVPFLTIGDRRARTAGAQAVTADPWDRAATILGRSYPPRFPSRDFEITKWGAVGDGAADCTDAIRRAIAACRDAGGGRVVVPDGRFLTGAIHLESGVELHLSAGATLAFDHDARKYLPVVLTRWEGTELMNYSAFIYAFEASNVAVTGTGTLDGQADADHWWNWRGAVPAAQSRQAAARDALRLRRARGSGSERVFGEGQWLRPNFLQPYRCRNVLDRRRYR